MRCLYKRPLPCTTGAVLRTLFNGWATARRFRVMDARVCRFGCADGDDSIEHYATCPAVYTAWEDFLGRTHQCSPLEFLCLGVEVDSIKRLRMAFLYCLYSVSMGLFAESSVVNTSGLILRIRERRRYVAGRSVEVRRDLKEASGTRCS